MWGRVVSFRPFTEINASVRYGRADNCRKGTRKLRAQTQLQDTRTNAQDWNTGLIWRKGLGTSRADISGSGRQSCESEFNSRMWVFAVRNRPLDQTNASIVKNDVRMGWEGTRFLRWRVQLHRIRGWVVSFRPFTEINASVRKGRADNYRKGTRKLRARVQLQDTRQKDRSKNNHL